MIIFVEGFDQYLGDGVFVSSTAMRWKRYDDGSLAQVPDTRPRCIKDGKVVFKNAGDAKRAAQRATSRGTRMKHYCGDCGHWHTARIKQKGL
jgi:hypothetical protein